MGGKRWKSRTDPISDGGWASIAGRLLQVTVTLTTSTPTTIIQVRLTLGLGEAIGSEHYSHELSLGFGNCNHRTEPHFLFRFSVPLTILAYHSSRSHGGQLTSS